MDPENVYCRLCAQIKPSYQQVNLQCDLERLREINEKLVRINAKTEFVDTKLPSTVCLDCLRLIDQCFEFVVGIKCAQNTLTEILSKPINVKKECHSDEEVFVGSDERSEEPPVEREGYVHIKIERIIKECLDKPTKPPPTAGKPRKIEKSESLDSIPLAQLKQTWEDYSWLCTYCQTQFQKIEDLQTHSMAVHTVCNPYRCAHCKLRKQCLDTFIIHVQRHNKRLKYSCFKCFKKFKTIVGCQKHRKTHVDSELNCPGCNTTFETSEELQLHKKTFFRFKGTKKSDSDIIAPQIDGKTCLVCSKTFTSKGNVRMHVRRMHTVRQANHICDICGKAFYERANHAEHMMLVHTDNRPHKCHICNVAFKTPNTLKDHIGRHFNEKPLTCADCGKTFRLKKHLKKHSIMHSDKLPFQCTYCEKRFQRREYLVNHLMQHTGERPYSCEPCQIHFTNWGNYNKHMICRHNENKARKKAVLVDEV